MHMDVMHMTHLINMHPPPFPPNTPPPNNPQLPIAPDEAAREAQHAADEAARAARAAYEGDQAVLRALRQVLREVTYRLIADRRWQTFVQPVEDPEYWAKVGVLLWLLLWLCTRRVLCVRMSAVCARGGVLYALKSGVLCRMFRVM